MSTAILVIWTVVAWQGAYDTGKYNWRSLGEFKDATACEVAAQQLALARNTYRCILTGKKL